MSESKIETLLENYISNLDVVFSLNDEVDEKTLKDSGKKLANSYIDFKSKCFEQGLEQMARTNEKVREEIQSLLPLAKRIANIKKVTEREQSLINAINTYSLSRIALFSQSFQEVAQKALNDSEVSRILENFVRYQKRQKYLLTLSFVAIAITFLGLFPYLSIPMAIASIGLFFWERHIEGVELKKLKKVGREIKASGLSEIKKITDSVNKMVDFSEYVSNIKTESYEEIELALEKLENNERLDLESIIELTSSVTGSLTKMNQRFGLQ